MRLPAVARRHDLRQLAVAARHGDRRRRSPARSPSSPPTGSARRSRRRRRSARRQARAGRDVEEPAADAVGAVAVVGDQPADRVRAVGQRRPVEDEVAAGRGACSRSPGRRRRCRCARRRRPPAAAGPSRSRPARPTAGSCTSPTPFTFGVSPQPKFGPRRVAADRRRVDRPERLGRRVVADDDRLACRSSRRCPPDRTRRRSSL